MNKINGNYLKSNIDTQEYVAQLNKLFAIQLEQLRQQFENTYQTLKSNYTTEGIEVINLSVINKTYKEHNLVYQMINKQNGCFYIGKHTTINPLDSYYGSGIILKESYIKNGLSSFQKKILYDFETPAEAFEKEKELIPILSCHDYNPMCYNMKPGGIGQLTSTSAKKGARTRKRHGYVPTKETRLKISKRVKGKPKSSTHKQHLSDSHRTNKEYMYKIQSSGKVITEITTMPKLAKKFNIKNVQQLYRKSGRCEYYEGILVISLIDYERLYYQCLPKDQLLYVDPITKQLTSYNCLFQYRKKKSEYSAIGSIF